MTEIKLLAEYAENNDFENFSTLFLKSIKEEDPTWILKELNKKVNFISQRPTKKTASKNIFLCKLRTLFENEKLDTNFFDTIIFFENSYAEILKRRRKTQGNFSGEYLIGVILIDLYIHNYHLNKHVEYLLEHTKFINEKSHLNATPYGENIDPDNAINALSKLLTHNINMESYQNNWFNKKNDIAILPSSILKYLKEPDKFIHTSQNFSNTLLIETGLWDIIQEADFNFRLLKEDITFHENSKVTISENNDSSLLIYALISRERMHRIMYNNFHKVIELFGHSNLSLMQREKINFEILLHIDIESDFEYDGLTIKEWIKSFLLLKAISSYTLNPIILTDEELKNYFKSIHISEKKCEKVIDSLLFKKNTPDVFDTPIIKFTDNLNLLIPFGLKAPNFINIISSILSNKKLALKNKGENFEKNAFSFFKRLESKFNFKCTNPSRKFDDEEYQFDILIEWDNYIFIIECKNRSIPNTQPKSLSDFREKIDKYTYQVNRLKTGLVKHSKEFSVDISNKEIIPVILNALPFSLDFRIDEVVFTDFSIVSRFFSERYLTKKTRKDKVIKTENIFDQWKSNSPDAINFLTYISEPQQVIEAKGRVQHSQTEHEVLEYSLVFNRSTVN